ncbi:6-bladed beta-propeller [Marinagarivorans algicola]|uniref:6-bladed beta-propeller n=1 Tax=Marinagarivorans algicola TaxID=1513270 RepID=UPI003734D5B0
MNKLRFIALLGSALLRSVMLWAILPVISNACPLGEGSAFKPLQTPAPFIYHSQGAHPFSLIEPTNFAINNLGQLVVIDSEAGQVKIVTLQGQELTYFATHGSSPGQLLNAKGLALDEKGSIFIADTGNHRIQRFDTEGRLIKTWGQWGYGDGQLNSPTGIAVDQQFVYVSDTGNNRIVVFNKKGQFIRSFGSFGDGDKNFNQPLGIATDGYGNVYIADSQNNKIKKYSRHGQFYHAWGAGGHLPGQLSVPYGITVYQGLLYIAELGNHRIQVFKENGEYFRALSLDHIDTTQDDSKIAPINSADIRVHYPASFAISANGQYTIACEPQAIRCNAYREGKRLATAIMEDSTRWEFGPSGQHYASSIAVVDGVIAVLNAEEHSIALFERTQIGNVQFVSTVGGFGQQAGLFKSPTSVAISHAGHVLAVSDSHNHRIQLFNIIKNSQGVLTGVTFKMSLGHFGHAVGQFNTPTKIQFDEVDNLHVLDFNNQRIQIFDKKFIFSQSYPLPSAGNASIIVSDFLFVNKNKKMFINPSSKVLAIVDKNNNLEQKLGERSIKNRKRQMQEDRFVSPSHMAVDKDNNVYITDQGSQKVKKFNAKGDYVTAWGQWGSGNGEFYKPKGIAIDKGIVYVVDYGNYRVQQLSVEGVFLGEFMIGQRRLIAQQ